MSLKTREGWRYRVDVVGQRHDQLLCVEAMEQCRRRVAGDELSAIDDGDVVAQRLGFFEVVCGEENGDATGVHLLHVGPQALTQFDVDAGGRLVQHQNRRRVQHRLGDQQAAAHAARQGAGIGFRFVGEADRFENFLGAALGVRDAVIAGLKIEQRARAEEGIDVELLRHHADRQPAGAGVGVEIVVPNFHVAGALHHQPGQNVDQRRFAGAVRAEQAEERATRDGEIDALERRLGRPQLAGGVGLDQTLYLNGIDRQGVGRGGVGRVHKIHM